jgi:CMP/dCMP kinase
MAAVPVVTIDGPSGSGKGTVAQRLANTLGWHYLDSGALYRATAWAIQQREVDPESDAQLMELMEEFEIKMLASDDGSVQVLVFGEDISAAIRAEKIGLLASHISSNPLIRRELFSIQLAARKLPGLVTDGRDMGTVVFPDAPVKLFLEASAEIRARRRCKQLQQRGINGNLREIEADLVARDQRDRSRKISPTRPAEEASILDTSSYNADEVFQWALNKVEIYFG